MADDKTIEEYIRSKPSVQSVGDLKKSLMRRAWDGESKHTPAQMILLIQWRLSANRLTEQDKAVLDDVKACESFDQPRSVLMLNAITRQTEQMGQQGQVMQRTRYAYNPATPTAPAPSSLQ